MSFECPKKLCKKIFGTSDSWQTSHLSHQLSEPAYCIVDCQILGLIDVLHPKSLMLEVRLGMKNADGKKYDENCEKFELGSFSYRGPNSSETMTISVRNHRKIVVFW